MTESEDEARLRSTRQEWDRASAHFDDEPDHGLRDPAVRQAWTALLRQALPPERGSVLDIGCGTGSLSVVLAGLGWQVSGIDASPGMIAQAQAKAAQAGYVIPFEVMDAAYPTFPPQFFDAILCRHLLWALPEPEAVLQRWVTLLKPGGWLLLIEGYWHTGAGLHAEDIAVTLLPWMERVTVENLSDQPNLWGRPVEDERYLIRAQRLY